MQVDFNALDLQGDAIVIGGHDQAFSKYSK